MDNCKYSNRRATSFKIIMQEDYDHFAVCNSLYRLFNFYLSARLISHCVSCFEQTVPCYFKEKLNKYGDKWLHALAAGHRLDFYLEKSTNSTAICGPWWSYFLMSHLVDVNDVVTFKLPTEDDSEDELDDEDAEGMEYEEEAGDGIFQVSVADPDGNQKPFFLMNGMYITLLETCQTVSLFNNLCSLFCKFLQDQFMYLSKSETYFTRQYSQTCMLLVKQT
jgi:hypothetical protein